jgi:hypothetical protein
LTSPLYIPKTDETPEVNFNLSEQVLSMKGRSLPENAFAFYEPIILWIKEMSKSKIEPLNFEIQLDYFNSSSGRFLFEIFTIIEQSPSVKNAITVRWVCESDDDLMIEKGEELRDLLDLNFSLEIIN